jgi:hypothetical protein
MVARGFIGALLLAGALGTTAAALPPEPVQLAGFEPVFLDGGLGFRRPEPPALLALPPGFLAGDAIVVLTPDDGWPRGQRERLATAILGAGAGVLEMNRPRAARMAEDIAAALRTLRRSHAPGLMVVIGRGEAGDIALAAAAEALDAAGVRDTAAIRLGPGEPAFGLAGVRDLLAFPERPGLLCDILGAALAAGEADAAGACRAVAQRLRR